MYIAGISSYGSNAICWDNTEFYNWWQTHDALTKLLVLSAALDTKFATRTQDKNGTAI